MDFSMQQETAQRQQLSAQMLHSLTILRMNAQELREYIDNLALDNPVVEVVPPPLTQVHIPDGWRVRSAQPQPEAADRRGQQTLQADLRFQLLGLKLDRRMTEAVEYLIASVDESGYLRVAPEELADAAHPASLLREALKYLHQLEPKGVGASSLAECLVLQLQAMPGSALAITIAEHYLPELAKNKAPQLAKQLGCSLQEVRQAEALIRRCTPKPGNGYAPAGVTEYVQPDLYIFENEEHQLQIIPDETACPYIQINSFYQALAGERIDPDSSHYLQEKIAQASSAISFIAKRNITLLQCARVLAQKQELFFRKGPKLLRPLGLREVAEQLQISESTVSRTLQGKYFRCIWGIYPLKHLVQRGFVAGTNGSEMNVHAICAAIEDLIVREDKRKPLSDQAISEELLSTGVAVSRRTVTKYREQCGIGTAFQRRLK